MEKGVEAVEEVRREVGEDGLKMLDTLVDSGVSADETADILNFNKYYERYDKKDKLKSFHHSLSGDGPLNFYHLLLTLVEMGHTISEAALAIRNHKNLVINTVKAYRYQKTYDAVVKWKEYDRLSDDEKKKAYDKYKLSGPPGKLAKLIQKRMKDSKKRKLRKANAIRRKRNGG